MILSAISNKKITQSNNAKELAISFQRILFLVLNNELMPLNLAANRSFSRWGNTKILHKFTIEIKNILKIF
jgi:hypothetical protein